MGRKKFGKEEEKIFESIRSAFEPLFLDAAFRVEDSVEEIRYELKRLLNPKHAEKSNLKSLSYKKAMPMSQLNRYWIYPDVREFVMPYKKRSYISNRTDLSTNGWIHHVTDLVHSYISHTEDLKLSLQFQPFGGRYSSLRGNDYKEYSSHSWRDDATMWTAMDCFYEVGQKANRSNVERAHGWCKKVEELVGPGGLFCEQDRRILAFSFNGSKDLDGGVKLSSVWDKYYDSLAKYKRLQEIKMEVDPDGVFSPNAFGICSGPDSNTLNFVSEDEQQLDTSQEDIGGRILTRDLIKRSRIQTTAKWMDIEFQRETEREALRLELTSLAKSNNTSTFQWLIESLNTKKLREALIRKYESAEYVSKGDRDENPVNILVIDGGGMKGKIRNVVSIPSFIYT